MSDESSAWHELAVAEEAVESGDFKHALHHIAPVLLDDPESADALRLLGRVAAEFDGDPLTLLELEGEVYAGSLAIAALLCARNGRSELAVTHVLQVVKAVPHAKLLVLLQKWSRDPAFVRSLPIDAAAESMLGFAFHFPDADGEHLSVRLTELLDSVENFRLHAPGHHGLAYVHSMVLRRLGRPREALEAARDVLGSATDLRSVVGLAVAHREAGELAEAAAVYERASRIDPSNAAIHLDIGDMRLALEKFRAAIVAYERALKLETDNPWAVASITYARYRLTNDTKYLDALDDLAFAGNENALTRAVAASPYLAWLPDPSEATVNLLAQLAEANVQVKPGEPFRFTLSALETPSSRLAFDRWAVERGFGQPSVTIQTVPRPDPRQPWNEVAFTLWRFDGMDPSPAVAPPRSAEIKMAVAALAARPYDAYEWFTHARTLAVPPDAIDDLLACMVHPPPADPRWTPWVWMHRVQFAAAMLIAASGGRSALHALIHGPIDWTTSAAIIALTVAAAAGAADVREARAWLRALWGRAPDTGQWTVEAPLVFALLRFPGLDAPTRNALRHTRAAILGEMFGEPEAAPEPPKPEKKGFLRRLFGR